MADVAAVAFGLWLAAHPPTAWWRVRAPKHLEGEKIRRTVALGSSIFYPYTCLVSAFAYFTAQGPLSATWSSLPTQCCYSDFHGACTRRFCTRGRGDGRATIGARDRDAFREAVQFPCCGERSWLSGFRFLPDGGVAVVDLLTGIDDTGDAQGLHLLVCSNAVDRRVSFILDGVYLRLRVDAPCAIVASLLTISLPVSSLSRQKSRPGLLLIFMGARGTAFRLRYPALQRSVGAA